MREFLLRFEGYFKRMPERDQKIFPYFMFVCIILIFYYLLIVPIHKKIKDLKTQNLDLSQKVFVLEQKVTVLETVRKGIDKKQNEYQSLKKRFEELTSKIPTSDQISNIVKVLAKSEKVDYMIRQLSEKNYITNDLYTEIPISVSLRGDYFKVFDFLKSIEDTRRFFIIKGLSFSSDEKFNGDVALNFDISAFKMRELDYYVNYFKRKKGDNKNGNK